MSGTNRVGARSESSKESGARKPYVQPKLAKRERLIEVTEGDAPVVTP